MKREVIAALSAAAAESLRAAGFNPLKPSHWRWSRSVRDRVDLLEILFADAKGYAPHELTSASFSVLAGTFLKGIPHPMGARFDGIDGQPVDSVASAHFALHVEPSLAFRGWSGRGVWKVTRLLRSPKRVAVRVGRSVETTVLDWFDSFDDLRQLLTDCDDALERGALGRVPGETIASPDLVLGLLAARLQVGALARKYLLRARERKNPASAIDGTVAEQLLLAQLSQIDEALAQYADD